MNFESMSKYDYRTYVMDVTGIDRISDAAFNALYDHRTDTTPKFLYGVGDIARHANRRTIVITDVELAFQQLKHFLISSYNFWDISDEE